MSEPKSGTKWYVSKRLILGAVTLITSFLQYKYGMVVDGATQGMIVGVAILVIGILTKDKIVWTESEAEEEKKKKDYHHNDETEGENV